MAIFAPNQRQSSCFSSRTSSLTTTMLITFNPPIGDTIRIARPALFPLSQPIVLHFTARLSAHDYNDLVQQEARVELWSDLPRDQESGWGKLEFSESRNDSALDSSSQMQDNQVKTLDISVSIPAATSATCRFSFTYRITYASGHITWLGAFGQDGLLIFEHNVDYGLVLRQGWHEDDTQESWIFEIPEGISSTAVANVKNPSNFRILALGKDGFIPHPGNTSILFLIPNSQRDSVTLNPTYVMSASPNSFITISSEGHITASGPGPILLQTNNIASEAGLFIREIISRSKLDRWSLLSFNSKINVIALACPTAPSAQDLRQVVVIPLWSLQNIQLPLNLANSFADKSKSDAIAMAIFASSRSGIHILDREIDDEICLELGPLDATSTDFHYSVCPVYRLQQPATKFYENWAVAVLTPHKRASTPLFSNQSGILPTPPPSPHLRPIPTLSQLPSSAVNNMSPTLALVAPPDKSAHNDESCAEISPEPVVPSVATNLPPPETLVSLFTYIFASLKSFFSLFLKTLGPILPFGFGIGQANFQGQSEASPPGDLDHSANGPEQSIAEEINVIPKKGVPGSHHVPGDSRIEESMPPEQEDVEFGPISSESTADVTPSRTQPKIPLRALHMSEDVLCVELQYNESQEEGSTTATVEIVFIPLPSRLSGNRDVDPVYAIPQPNPKDGLERAVRFLDGSVAPSRLREVDVFFHDTSARGNVTRKSSCYMLQYQVDVVSLKKGKVISVLPPAELGV